MGRGVAAAVADKDHYRQVLEETRARHLQEVRTEDGALHPSPSTILRRINCLEPSRCSLVRASKSSGR
jgi:hypothetical protein